MVTSTVGPWDTGDRRAWVNQAIATLRADANRSADTHLLRLPLPKDWGVEVYLKDESTHLTGSLKHRLARSLFLYSLVNGWVGPSTTIVEASSGSTAISEAYFARLLGLRFVAVMPSTTSADKIRLIERHGGRCHLVDEPATVYDVAARLAGECDGHYMDQFTFAERATDWRGNNNIAESVLEQLRLEAHPVPTWVVVGAGTGGTASTFGRYVRYQSLPTRICVVDPENSAFHPGWSSGDLATTTTCGSRIEGIGRQRVEPSFIPGVVDRMITVPDAASIAAMRHVSALLGSRFGPSTGTNLWGTLQLVAEMREAGETGSLVTLLCDDGARYAATYFDDGWLAEHDLDVAAHDDEVRRLFGGLAGPAPA
ncbi:MAG TPA: PLP-dependent cysteine synthase family protein [Nocardioides sp.]|nr:PLP-dependent cysteine synthase family protein [Nocardioides sp.]